MVLLLGSLRIADPFYFVADAYLRDLHGDQGLVIRDNHLISRVRSNGVAIIGPDPNRSQAEGRPGSTERRSNSAPSL